MPHRSGTLQLVNAEFLTRDFVVSVLSRVVSQAVNISISANSPYRIALRLVDWLDWLNVWRHKFAVLA